MKQTKNKTDEQQHTLDYWLHWIAQSLGGKSCYILLKAELNQEGSKRIFSLRSVGTNVNAMQLIETSKLNDEQPPHYVG